MECAYADHLRKIAVVAMSHELALRNKRRDSPGKQRNSQKIRDLKHLILLRQDTDSLRKALREHITDCGRCHTS